MYKSKIIGYKKIIKNNNYKLRVESEVIMSGGIKLSPSFELSASQTKKFLDDTAKKDIKPKLKRMFNRWLEENVEYLIDISSPTISKTKVEEL